jgi:hypothetical protein
MNWKMSYYLAAKQKKKTKKKETRKNIFSNKLKI